MYRIGVDVGGTNTDAVVMQGDKILSGVKSQTTEDVMTGVVDAVERALAEAGARQGQSHRGHGRHYPFHQCRCRAQTSGPHSCRAPVLAGGSVPAADGRLAR